MRPEASVALRTKIALAHRGGLCANRTMLDHLGVRDDQAISTLL